MNLSPLSGISASLAGPAKDEGQQMPRNRSFNLIHVNGFVSWGPRANSTPKGRVVVFGLGMPDGFGDKANIDWLDCSVWNEGLGDWVLKNVCKGAQVAATGFGRTTERDGRIYENLYAERVGLIKWGQRSPRPTAQTSEPAPRTDPAGAAPPDPDLDW